MSERDLEVAATAMWIPAAQVPPTGAVWGGEQRTFDTLREAIRFIMAELPAADRATAWIATDGASVKIEEIEQIYASPDFGR